MEMREKEAYTPMIQQYIDIKREYFDSIVFFRLGDFYEMFFDDAIVASKELEIALTGKDAGVEERIPMCGIPHHAYEAYANKLIENGHKVVIVEQIEDPKATKGIVKRGVVKILTPGTKLNNDNRNNFLAALKLIRKTYLLCYSDISIGECYLTPLDSLEAVIKELRSIACREVVVEHNFKEIIPLSEAGLLVSYEDNLEIPSYLTNIVTNIPKGYTEVVGILLNYAINTQKARLEHFKSVEFYTAEDYLKMDYFTKRNLEITETLRFNERSGSLLSMLDHTSTAMGSRMLKRWLDRPLVDLNKIKEREDYISLFIDDYIVREESKSLLKNVYDLERIIGKIANNTLNPKDMSWLKHSLSNIPNLKECLLQNEGLAKLANEIDTHSELYDLLDKAIEDNPPFSLKDGGTIKYGFNKDLDELHDISANSNKWLLEYEAKEKERLGVKNLKVGYNRVFGYYIEISKGQSVTVDPSLVGYVRKQTLSNSERYISEELKHYEDILLGAKDKILRIESEIFLEIKNTLAKYIVSLQALANLISTIDCYINLANVSLNNNYVRPSFNDEGVVDIIGGRHPVLEQITKDKYVTNDVKLNGSEIILITGPNMSGKSTYMRMLASIIILAQIGSFVPASSASLRIFDAIFTRIGASDDLSSGQSTFMIEMSEANYAISNATNNSLILFDEIGRGTATYDGMALAEAIIEYIHQKVKATTLFSTHYHELTMLEGKLKNLKNVHVEAVETNEGVSFLHKVKEGPTDKSYGINVASLAGMPKSLITRSKQILEGLEANNKNDIPYNLFDFTFEEEKEEKLLNNTKYEELVKYLTDLDVDSLTPREALGILYELKEKI